MTDPDFGPASGPAPRPAPGLARLRALLDPARLDGEPDDSAGYLDILGTSDRQPRTIAGLAMRSGLVAEVYQRGWRQTINLAMGAGGLSAEAEREYAVRSLRLDTAERVLDVACGPGNFTRVFAGALSTAGSSGPGASGGRPVGGLVVGLDTSPAMLAKAVADTGAGVPRDVSARIGYLRADARRMPFPDGSFDAVCCYAALYLVPEPFTVLAEMLRVLAPGGRIALMTSYRGDDEPRRLVRGIAGLFAGVRMFDRDELPGLLRAAGLREIDQRVHNIIQFVNATKPDAGG